MKLKLPPSLIKWFFSVGLAISVCSPAALATSQTITTNTTKTVQVVISSLFPLAVNDYTINDGVRLSWTSNIVSGILGGGALNISSGYSFTSKPTNSTGKLEFLNCYTGLGLGGGAVFNSGTFTVSNALFQGNKAGALMGANGGGLNAATGALTTITNVTFTGNHADYGKGGAIYSNGTTLNINSGTFQSNVASDSGGALALMSGAASLKDVVFLNNSTGTYGGAIYAKSNFSLIVSSGTSLTSSGNTATSGGGFLYLSSGISGTFDIGASATYTIGVLGGVAGNDTIISADATASFVKNGTGTLTVNSSMSGFIGSVSINAGTLNISAIDSLNGASGINVASGAVLNTQGASQVLAALSGAGNVVTNNGSLSLGAYGGFTGSLSLGSGSLTLGAGTLSGTVTGTGTILKNGVGDLLLNSSLSGFSGTVSVSQGKLGIGSTGALSASNKIFLSAGTTLDTNGLNQTIGSLSGTGNVVTDNGGLTLSLVDHFSGSISLGSGNLIVGSGTVSGTVSGSGMITKNGIQDLILSGVNSGFTGNVAVSTGTLKLGAQDSLASALKVDLSGGTLLDTQGYGQIITRLSGSGNVSTGGGNLAVSVMENFAGNINIGAGDLTVGGGTISGTVSGSGTVIKNTSQTASIEGTLSVNALEVVAGTLDLTAGSVLDISNNIQVAANANISGSAVVEMIGGNIFCEGGLVDLVLESGSNLSAGTTVTAGGTLDLVLSGGSIWEVIQDSTLTSLVVESGGHLSFNISDLNDFTNLVASSLTLKSGAVIDLNFHDVQLDAEICLMIFAQIDQLTVEGDVLVNISGLGSGATYGLDNLETQGCITIIPGAIPEPATATLGLLGLGSCLLVRRRK